MGLRTLMQRNSNGIYQFRQRVPKELQEVLGKKEIKRSLGTVNQAEAKVLNAQMELEVIQEFANARQKIQTPIAIEVEDKPVILSHEEGMWINMLIREVIGVSPRFPLRPYIFSRENFKRYEEAILSDVTINAIQRQAFAAIAVELQRMYDGIPLDRKTVANLLDQANGIVSSNLPAVTQYPVTSLILKKAEKLEPEANATLKGEGIRYAAIFNIFALLA